MDDELNTLLNATQDEDFDWSSLALALQHRGYPSGSNGLKAVRARIKALQKDLESETKGILADEAKRLFAKHPKLESFSWRQYTPYWIDGDACSFSSDITRPDVNGQDTYGIKDPELNAAIKELHAVLKHFNDDYLMFRLFGDHKTVKVNREGIFVETYEHG